MFNTLLEDKSIKRIYEKIKDSGLKVVIPEGTNDRVLESIEYVQGITVVLLGDKDQIIEKMSNMYGSNVDNELKKIEIIEPKDFLRADLIDLFIERRNGKITKQKAEELIMQSNYFATLLLQNEEVDAMVGGVEYTTSDILKPAFQIIKVKEQNKIVSSFFLMKKGEEQLLFSDCAVNIEPNKHEVKEITRQTIESAREMGIDPRVALLSYSTKGSGFGAYVDVTKNVYDELIEESPELKKIIDGELQFDAAYSPEVRKLKCDSEIKEKMNVFIFPHLNSGNIGYKIAQYLGGYQAIGPILQGINKPVNDLSRGADAKTIATIMYLSLRKYVGE